MSNNIVSMSSENATPNSGVASLSIETVICPHCDHLNVVIGSTWQSMLKRGDHGHCIKCGDPLIEEITPLPQLTPLQESAYLTIKEAGGIIKRAEVAAQCKVTDRALGNWSDTLAHYGVEVTKRGYVYDSNLDKSLKDA